MRILGLFALILSPVLVALTGAQSYAQSASPQLQAAMDAWLADDDASALPAISALAASGDAQAGLLLGEIDRATNAEIQSDWLASLSGADRAALFQPGGAQMTEALAASGDTLAAMMLAASNPAAASVEVAHTLLAFGEKERARLLAWRMLEAGKLAEVVTVPKEEPLFREMDWLWWMQGWIAGGSQSGQPEQWVLVSEAKGRAAGVILANWSAQFIAAKTPLTPTLKRVAAALQGRANGFADAAEREYAEKFVSGLARRDPAMRPLGAICAQHCGQEIGACMLEGLRLIGGYGELMPLDTPYEGLIGQTPYSISKKAENNLRRLIRARRGAAKGEPLNQCLGQSVGG